MKLKSLLAFSVAWTVTPSPMPGLISQAPWISMSSFAFARTQVDSETRDLLIRKLTHVYLNLAPNDASRSSITQRLADLHAERGRLEAMAELASGCQVCKAGREDRLKALSYYKEVLAKLPPEALGKVLIQVGHLYELTGNEKEAIETYSAILKQAPTPGAVAEANLSLAELYFKRRDFAKARSYYSAVMEGARPGSQGWAAYRRAWCDFNEGRLESAIESLVALLKKPEWLARKSSGGAAQTDVQFHEEVSRDLATFLARRPVSIRDAEVIFEVSPESTRLANVTYLAQEVERLGQTQSAIELWHFVLVRQSVPHLRLEGHIRIAQLEMDLNRTPQAVADFEKALFLWQQEKVCAENSSGCSEMKARLRKFVLDWNRAEKKNPTQALLAAYQSYLKVFSGEIDMLIWAAEVAKSQKNFAQAFELYGRAAEIAHSKNPKASELETALLGRIEVAELSEDPKFLEPAYEAYIHLSQERKKLKEVRYQKARLLYDRGDYQTAAEALKSVALSQDPVATNEAQDIRKKAADLSLDALALLKDDTRLEIWAKKYAQTFESAKKDFLSIARQSVLNQTATLAASGESGLETAWQALTRFELSAASETEKAAYHKNRLILAEKLKRYPEARDAVESLLKMEGLGKEDLEFALSRKAWLSELALDFEGALTAAQRLSVPEGQKESQWLKLAMYAELAHRDPRPYYSAYLKSADDAAKKASVAAQMVRESKEPLKEIEKHHGLLLKNPELLASLYLEVIGPWFLASGAERSQASKLARKVNARPELAETDSAKVLNRLRVLTEFESLRDKMISHAIVTTSQKKLGESLKRRIALLDEGEKLATRAVALEDWTAQLLTLELLAHENERFHREILALPVPDGLSQEEEASYLELLSQQAAPHHVRASDIRKKVTEFWDSHEAALAAFAKRLEPESGFARELALKELKLVSDVAPEELRSKFAGDRFVASDRKSKPTRDELEGARQAVRESPLNREMLERLLNLEKEMGRQAMVEYLQGRLAALDGRNESESK